MILGYLAFGLLLCGVASAIARVAFPALLPVPVRGERWSCPDGVATVLEVRRETILLRIDCGRGLTALRSVPLEDWSWIARDWLPVAGDPDLLLPPPADRRDA